MAQEFDVKLPPFRKLVNEPFRGILKNFDRIILLWGGRGSGKSVAALRLLIVRMLIEPYFKCIFVRKVYEDVKESMFEAFRYEVEDLGLEDLFEFKLSPMSITCKNGNKIICKGLNKPSGLKSIKDPSCVWYEEGNQISEEDFITVSTSVRGNKARFLQEIITFNPETDGSNYEDFWLYKRFFAHHTERTFRDVTEIHDPIRDEIVEMTYTSIWSDYTCNPYLPPEFVAILEGMKKTNPYYYKVFTLGLWGNKDVSGQFYKSFSMDIVRDDVEYIPSLPLHLSFDENVNPYLTLTIHQVRKRDDKTYIWQIDEICLEHPKNTLRHTCDEFLRRYRGHTEGVFIYGDRTSVKADAKLEKGQNFFDLVCEYLKEHKPKKRLPSKNPNVKSRGEFINDIFEGRYKDVEFLISSNCTKTVDDYLNVVEDADGTKKKTKVKDKRTGVSFEKFGHTSDANDYLIVEVLKTKYLEYISGNKSFSYKTAKRSFVNRKNRF